MEKLATRNEKCFWSGLNKKQGSFYILRRIWRYRIIKKQQITKPVY